MNTSKAHISAILLAGGIGSRMGKTPPKQYLLLQGKPIALYSLEILDAIDIISEIIVVCAPSFQKMFRSDRKPLQFTLPGKERQDSLANGLSKVSSQTDYILTHDAARPLIKKEFILTLIQKGLPYAAATLGTPMHATVKRVDHLGLVKETLNREELFEIQTPQLTQRTLLSRGLQQAKKQGITYIDDTSLIESIGHDVKIVPGCETNIKITTPADLEFADFYLQREAYASL